MKNEDIVELTPYKSQQAPLYAFILSLAWNLLVLFCLFIVARQKQTRTFNVPCKPLVVFQNPLMPSSLAQNNPPMPLQQPAIAPQMPKQLQQIAMQQPQYMPSPEEDKLNYLVQQLISYGNSTCGAVVSAVDDVPGDLSSNGKPEPTVSAKQITELQPTAEEQGQDMAGPMNETSPDNSINSAQESEKSSNDSAAEVQALSNQDLELLQETARSIATTFPDQERHTQNYTPRNEHSVAHASAGGGHRLNNRSPRAYPPKERLSLADLTNSFMTHVRNDRQTKYNYDPHQKSGGTGMAGVYSPANNSCSGKELALQMYATKVFMMMQQSARALSSLIYANTDFTEQSLLEITIDRTGKLERVALNPPIHEKDIELAVQKIVEKVGLFPSIPKHFNMESITLTFPLNIQGSKGFGRYSLSYSTGIQP